MFRSVRLAGHRYVVFGQMGVGYSTARYFEMKPTRHYRAGTGLSFRKPDSSIAGVTPSVEVISSACDAGAGFLC